MPVEIKMNLDFLAFGAHPDDVELSCAGTLMIEKLNGKKVGVIDISQGELGTRGSAEERKKESDNASLILDLDVRENLSLADGFFKNDENHQREIVKSLRKYRPEIIFCNAPEDRHPDHGRGASLVEEAAFLSGLRKIETILDGKMQEEWRPKYVFNYIQDRYLDPDFIIDISPVFDRKLEAINAFKSQFFNPASDEPETYISSPDFLESIIYRARMMGKMIGVKYAEGFLSKKKIGFSNFDLFIKKDT